jgi:hypothetical protein
MRQTAVLTNPQQAHAIWSSLWSSGIKPALAAGQRLVVEVKPETRSLSQNSKLWACLTDVSRQVDWHGQKLEASEWKDVFTAALKRQKVVPGLEGGFVVLGSSTSRMSKAEMSELFELMYAFGAERDVCWTEPAEQPA